MDLWVLLLDYGYPSALGESELIPDAMKSWTWQISGESLASARSGDLRGTGAPEIDPLKLDKPLRHEA